ncbi:hypothetical protein EXN66_Car011127 [Channa argus]|uniref:Uncharacterized protein n=1 Tax=Channa argus TaxID=215402 RepID=A0A6G1PYN8_CHAAH|nr:hypothetical protein EXN66_Car011127 [Channa argus]
MSLRGSLNNLKITCCTIMALKNIFAAEDELQHSMDGVVCKLEFLNRKTKVLFWGRALGIELRKGLSVSKSAVCFVTHSGKVGQY